MFEGVTAMRMSLDFCFEHCLRSRSRSRFLDWFVVMIPTNAGVSAQ